MIKNIDEWVHLNTELEYGTILKNNFNDEMIVLSNSPFIVFNKTTYENNKLEFFWIYTTKWEPRLAVDLIAEEEYKILYRI